VRHFLAARPAYFREYFYLLLVAASEVDKRLLRFWRAAAFAVPGLGFAQHVQVIVHLILCRVPNTIVLDAEVYAVIRTVNVLWRGMPYCIYFWCF
jgi:hypothetical protein